MSTIEIPDPQGYRVVGYRPPKEGELYLAPRGEVQSAANDYSHRYPIVERIEVWRQATLDDLKRAPCKARMRVGPKQQWIDIELAGVKLAYSHPFLQWIAVNNTKYNECQVLDEERA
jgi:hypothetical protein